MAAAFEPGTAYFTRSEEGLAMLFTEIVSRTFTGGALTGIVIEQRIERVSDPRPIGATQAVAKPIGGGSPYRDEVVAVEVWRR